jgi:hypothetical protein
MPNDLRFLRCVMAVTAELDHIPVLHVIEIIRATLAEVDRHAVDEIELAEAFRAAGLDTGERAA